MISPVPRPIIESTTLAPADFVVLFGTNNTSSAKDAIAVGNLYLRDGTPYPGNPVIGPLVFRLPGGTTIEKDMSATVSGPVGQYTVEGVVSVGGSTISSDTFVMAILP